MAKWLAQVESRDSRLATQDSAIAELKAMVEQLTLKKQSVIPPSHNPTVVESARPIISSQMHGGYAHYTPEYAFTTLPRATPSISVAPNMSILQRMPTQGLVQGLHLQEPHQVPHHSHEPPLHGPTPLWTYGYNSYNAYAQPLFMPQGRICIRMCL